MRSFIRHPSDIPIEIHPFHGAAREQVTTAVREREYLNNVSTGGISFKSGIPLQMDAVVTIRIPVVKPAFEAKGKVVWCHKENDHYNVGAEFIELRDMFRARMVEQVCRIEHYKKEIYEREGRALSGQEAALEWIRKFAPSFQDDVVEEQNCR